MELQVKEDYELDNLVKDWGFKKVEDREYEEVLNKDFDYYFKSSTIGIDKLEIFGNRQVSIFKKGTIKIVDDEILCLLYDLIQAGIIVKV